MNPHFNLPKRAINDTKISSQPTPAMTIYQKGGSLLAVDNNNGNKALISIFHSHSENEAVRTLSEFNRVSNTHPSVEQ
jgi:hypothetical protein